MATTSLGISNQVTLAHGATVEFTVSWDWGDQTFNEMFFASYRYTYADADPAVAGKKATTTAAIKD